jgi:flagellar basal-body rod protein FlgC
MSIASTIAASGMNAAALRLQISASNVGNLQSSGSLPDGASAGNYPPAYNALTVN